MFNLLKQAIRITNNNLLIIIPLILFIKLMDVYYAFSRYNLSSMPKLLVTLLTVVFMFGMFCSGWLIMIRGAIDNSKKTFISDVADKNASLGIFRLIPEGINRFFLSFVGVYIIFTFIQIFLSPFVYILGVKLIGNLQSVSLDNIQNLVLSSNDANSVAALIDKLTPEQILFFAKWSFLLMFLTSIVMYLLMLWVPEIIYKTPNPFMALFKSIGKLFRNFLQTFPLFCMLWVIGFILLFLNTFSLINPFAYLLMNVIMFYFSVCLIVCVFLFYDKKYCNDEK